MSDCLIFSTLFATFAVLGNNYGGGPGPKELFELNLVAVNTALLLISSITFGFAMLAMQDNDQPQVMKWLAITAACGLGFLCIELHEFTHLIGVGEGAGPSRSAFLSAFFVPGRHPWTACYIWSDLDGTLARAGPQTRADHGEPPALAWAACRCSGISLTSSGSAYSPLSISWG
ncbi:UNVERIFIED_CONTAM: hypothetical protein GTU68_056109 [Idotea baltica]|nr:hypothetical protein [Idotea baltica]